MNYKQVQEIIKDFENSSIRELILEMDGFKIKLSKNDSIKEEVILEKKEEVLEKKKDVPNVSEGGIIVTTPLVGTFYEASAPGRKPFVKVGDKVKEKDVLFIVEAMKIMNEITAAQSGVVTEIYVKDGDAIGFDQKVMKIV